MKSVGSPAIKSTRQQLDGDRRMDLFKMTPYRAVVAMANRLASGQPEWQFSGKAVCRWMAALPELALAVF